MTRLVLAALAAALLLTACGGDDHKGEHCAQESTVYVPMTTYIQSGSVSIPITNYVPVTNCDQWVPDNPATVHP